MSDTGQRPPVGVLVVHGIGAQQPGETLAKLWSGLRRTFAALPEKPTEGHPVTLGDRTVRFYEVYWADLLTGDQVSGTFDIKELSSLAWFPLFNQTGRLYANEPYPRWTVIRWTLVLPIANFALQLTYWGARMLTQIYHAVRHRHESTIEKLAIVERIKRVANREARRPAPVDKLLDEFVGDVFNYINSAGDSFSEARQTPEHLRQVYRGVLDRFYEQLKRAHGDGCERVQIVAHSLGTVVMYHGLRGLRFDEPARSDADAIAAAVAGVEHIYTIGSPLEKIRFFWPRLRPERNLVGERPLAWDNFVSYFDPVAGVLRRYREWGEVNNHRLLGGGFMSGHVVYERSPTFLEAFARGLTGKPVTLQRTARQRIKDWALLLGETLAAPAGLLVLLVVGVGLWVLAAMLVPFLVSLLLRLFLSPETWGPIVDYGSAFFGGMFLLVFLIVPIIDAKRAVGRLRANGEAADAGG